MLVKLLPLPWDSSATHVSHDTIVATLTWNHTVIEPVI